MKRLLLIAAMGFFAATNVYAQDKKLTMQQERMKTCNAEASGKNLKGDERKAFMSRCLKGEGGQLTSQQERMRSCNREAGEKALKGDARKKFMSECLKAPA